MKKILPFIAVVLLAIACNNENHEQHTNAEAPKTKADSLLQEVVDGHDEAMAAQMTKLKRAKEQLSHMMDSLEKKSGNAASVIKTQFADAQAKLDNASAAMSKWMDEFNMDSAKSNIEERVKYLADEKLKVGNVKDMIFESINKADSLIGTLKK